MWSLLLIILESVSTKKSNQVLILIFQIEEALPLGALDYLHVGTKSGGSGLKLGIVLGHGWEEHGSSQFIQLVDMRLELDKFIL